MPELREKIFAVPPGVDFARELVAGLCLRLADEPPEEMARLTLFVNSGRMMRRVREEFDRLEAGFLPKLCLLSDIARFPIPGLALPVPALRRKLELAGLIHQMAQRIPGFEAGSGIFKLGDSLGALLAEMQDEGVTPDDLERLDIQASHAEHWQRSLAFIRVVARYFETDAQPDAEGRQRLVAQHLLGQWQNADSKAGRIIIAGSTGSRGATRLLMRAAMAHPLGQLVLPGFDFDMPSSVWNSLCSGQTPLEDHPQYRFARLLGDLGLNPNDVQPWAHTPPACPTRNRLVALALRPAPVTDQWMTEGRKLTDIGEACAGMSLIEAKDPRQEAQAIALAMRHSVEQGVKVALITPDRMLTRRVTAALSRWGIIPDDSAGQPLNQTAPGRLIRHLGRCFGRQMTLEALLILLKHPLAATGSTLRGPHLRLTREMELRFRRFGPAFPSPEAILAWGESGDAERRLWADWVAAFLHALPAAEEKPISAWLETHLTALSNLAAGPQGAVSASELWLGEAGEACRQILNELQAEAADSLTVSAANYAELLDTLLSAGQVRSALAPHPLVTILGTLEARVHDAERVILGGLNEGSWPAAISPDPWLSRKMRLDAGLLLPERQVGLAAHDFQQAIAATEVILSRASRDSDTETVPSRWLNRLLNLLGGLHENEGPAALAAMRQRGGRWADLAALIDLPGGALPSAPRPSPRPPVEARPRQLSVTAIKTLIRDPYAIYARQILRLRPLDPLRPTPDARERGITLHKIVEMFLKDFPDPQTPDSLMQHLLTTAEEVLRTQVPWPSAQRLWFARIARIAPVLVADELCRRQAGAPALVEQTGSVLLSPMAFTLTAKPDRIDLLNDGTAQVFDYKSSPPTDPEVKYYDKQLLLEAAMISRGAFGVLGPRRVSGMTYIQLGGLGASRDLKMGEPEIEETWADIHRLLARYLSAEQGFTARRAMKLTRDKSDYDHLSRFGEWDLTQAPNAEDVP